MPQPVIRQILAGPYMVHTYLVACPETGEGVIIDPAGDEDKVAAAVREEGVEIKYILNTHGHADHVIANTKMKELLGCPTVMHEADDDFFQSEEGIEMARKDLGLPPPGPVDLRVGDGDVIEAGRLKIEVLHTPGHTPGSVCFYVDGNLFTGDTLFVGAVGRTDLAGGSLDTLLASIEKKLLGLPPETIVWPGHDYGETPTSTLEREMEENPFITDFILD